MQEHYFKPRINKSVRRAASWLVRGGATNNSIAFTESGLPHSTTLSHVRVIEAEPEAVAPEGPEVPKLITELNQMYDTCLAKWEAEDSKAAI